MEISAGRSGRTTRMLEHAADLAACGCRVTVVVPDLTQRRRLAWEFRQHFTGAVVANVGFEAIDANALDDHRLRGRAASVYMYDHTWYEQRAKVWRLHLLSTEIWPSYVSIPSAHGRVRGR